MEEVVFNCRWLLLARNLCHFDLQRHPGYTWVGLLFMIRSIKTFAWLRDLVIVLLFIAGFNLWHSSPRLGILLVGAAAVVFVERVLWSWYLLDLRDQQNGSSTS